MGRARPGGATTRKEVGTGAGPGVRELDSSSSTSSSRGSRALAHRSNIRQVGSMAAAATPDKSWIHAYSSSGMASWVRAHGSNTRQVGSMSTAATPGKLDPCLQQQHQAKVGVHAYSGNTRQKLGSCPQQQHQTKVGSMPSAAAAWQVGFAPTAATPDKNWIHAYSSSGMASWVRAPQQQHQTEVGSMPSAAAAWQVGFAPKAARGLGSWSGLRHFSQRRLRLPHQEGQQQQPHSTECSCLAA
eukprot:94957-Pelagomonas_calceolata.AAC.7